jgi:hypothetical protein
MHALSPLLAAGLLLLGLLMYVNAIGGLLDLSIVLFFCGAVTVSLGAIVSPIAAGAPSPSVPQKLVWQQRWRSGLWENLYTERSE